MNLSEFLNILDFSYDITTDNKIRLIDLQGANLGEIEEERFEINSDTTSNIVERLSTYIDDYIFISNITQDLFLIIYNTTENLIHLFPIIIYQIQ